MKDKSSTVLGATNGTVVMLGRTTTTTTISSSSSSSCRPSSIKSTRRRIKSSTNNNGGYGIVPILILLVIISFSLLFVDQSMVRNKVVHQSSPPMLLLLSSRNRSIIIENKENDIYLIPNHHHYRHNQQRQDQKQEQQEQEQEQPIPVKEMKLDNDNDATNSSNNNNDRSDTDTTPIQYNKKPNFVLHIGPPKTATTTIQETMVQWDQQGILFTLDKYLYIQKMGLLSLSNNNSTNTSIIPDNIKLYKMISYQFKNKKCSLKLNKARKQYARTYARNKLLKQQLLEQEQQQEQQNRKYRRLRNGRTRSTSQNMVVIDNLKKKKNSNMNKNDTIRNSTKSISMTKTDLGSDNKLLPTVSKEEQEREQSLFDFLVQTVPCAKNIVNVLEPYSINHTNLLYSDETLSFSWMNGLYFHDVVRTTTTTTTTLSEEEDLNTTEEEFVVDVVDDHYRMLVENNKNKEREQHYSAPLDLISLFILLQPYYNITVIIGYRRYHEWLLSAKQQVERWKPSKPRMNLWPVVDNQQRQLLQHYQQLQHTTTTSINNTSTSTEEEMQEDDHIFGGRVIESLLPTFWKHVGIPGVTNVIDMPYRYTDTLLECMEQVTDYFSYDSSTDASVSTSASPTSAKYGSTVRTVVLNMHLLEEQVEGVDEEDELKTTTSASFIKTSHDGSFNERIAATSPTTTRMAGRKKVPIISNFLCNTLPDARNLCQYSIQLDQLKNGTEPRLNPRMTTDYDQLVCAASGATIGSTTTIRSRLDVDDENNSSTSPSTNTFLPLFNTSLYKRKRHWIALAAQQYHTELLLSIESTERRSHTNNNNLQLLSSSSSLDNNDTDDDDVDNNNNNNNNENNKEIDYEFPLLCPTYDEYNEFLQHSLYYERQMFPTFYDKSPDGYEQHSTEFWYSSKNYCSIDINKIIQQQHWIDFFQIELPKRVQPD